MPYSGAVLTGGAGRRMGSGSPAKPLVELSGRPLVSYPLAVLIEAGAAEVMAIGGDETVTAALEELGLDVVADPARGWGPLGAVVRSLQHANHELVVILACDTPLVRAETIARLVAAAQGFDGAVGQTGGHLEPLIAAYRTSARSVFEAALRSSGAIHRALSGLQLARIDVDSDEALNVNTPADLERAEAVLRRRSTSPEGGGR